MTPTTNTQPPSQPQSKCPTPGCDGNGRIDMGIPLTYKRCPVCDGIGQPPQSSSTPRTDACPSSIGFLSNLARTLELELGEANKKLAYVERIGMQIGYMKSSDKPEPYLAHTWTDDSDHEKIYREWSSSIGLRQQLTTAQAEIVELRKEIDFQKRLYENYKPKVEQWHGPDRSYNEDGVDGFA